MCRNNQNFLLPEKLNQDHLEVFFARLRHSVGHSDNPSVPETEYRFLALLLAGSKTGARYNANCVVAPGLIGTETSKERKHNLYERMQESESCVLSKEVGLLMKSQLHLSWKKMQRLQAILKTAGNKFISTTWSSRVYRY